MHPYLLSHEECCFQKAISYWLWFGGLCACVYYENNHVARSLLFFVYRKKKEVISVEDVLDGFTSNLLVRFTWTLVCFPVWFSLFGLVWTLPGRDHLKRWFVCGVKAEQTDLKILWQWMCDEWAEVPLKQHVGRQLTRKQLWIWDFFSPWKLCLKKWRSCDIFEYSQHQVFFLNWESSGVTPAPTNS